MKVCKQWLILLKCPSLWNRIDLVSFPVGPNISDAEDEDLEKSVALYADYRKKSRRYIGFLLTIRPKIEHLTFSFDIADAKDGWMEYLEALLCTSRLDNIESANIVWNETRAKPAVLDCVSITWCTNDYKDLMYKHRHRQRYFVKFFDLFTSISSSLVSLTIPFDWTERSIRSLNRLHNLKYLDLVRYFMFQSLDQWQIDILLLSVPHLQRLKLEVWTPSGSGLHSIKVRHGELRLLDISKCKGLSLGELDTLKLEILWVTRTLMRGPLSISNVNISDRKGDGQNLRETLYQGNDNRASVTQKVTKCVGESFVAKSVTNKVSPQRTILNMFEESRKVQSAISPERKAIIVEESKEMEKMVEKIIGKEIKIEGDNSSISSSVATDSVICLLEMLRKGAPELLQLNGADLLIGWRDSEEVSARGDMQKVLRRACFCGKHQTSMTDSLVAGSASGGEGGGSGDDTVSEENYGEGDV